MQHFAHGQRQRIPPPVTHRTNYAKVTANHTPDFLRELDRGQHQLLLDIPGSQFIPTFSTKLLPSPIAINYLSPLNYNIYSMGATWSCMSLFRIVLYLPSKLGPVLSIAR